MSKTTSASALASLDAANALAISTETQIQAKTATTSAILAALQAAVQIANKLQ